MRPLATVLLLVTTGASAIAQQSPLRVVVIEGEDGVNIIQQKTAVRPVVEVRDRNNLPVSGALVTFSIEGGKAATFGGASTLTVATNAAGQAAVSSLTPTVSGAFQIQVSAAFQGQVATATIAQTNVLTAAQAAAAASANGASAGAAGGAGGGLSATTIAVAGAAVAGGAVAVTQVAGGDGAGSAPEQHHFSGSFTGTTTETIVLRITGQTCVTTRAISASARIELDPNEPNNVNGNLLLTGSSTVTSVSAGCGGVGQVLSFGGGTSVSGTQAALRGTSTNSTTSAGPNGETIVTTLTNTFDGAVNGNTISGTLNREQKGIVTGPNGTSDSLQIGTFSLTLTKS
jgi:hypothetical protein